jgi:dolichol kinase
MQPEFLVNQAVLGVLLFAVAYLSSLLVIHKNVKVNYTRKINHFALFFLPMIIDKFIAYERSVGTTAAKGAFVLFLLALYAKPVRERVAALNTAFISFDRPEDRPHSLSWLWTQVLAGYVVLLPLYYFFQLKGIDHLIYIPILINGIGDGLAEPVGVRFGRHTYATRPIFGDKLYTRSYEGSACVLVTGFATVGAFHGSFTASQLTAALVTIPLSMTLAEAFSPHTWDTPFLFLVGALLLLGILSFVP